MVKKQMMFVMMFLFAFSLVLASAEDSVKAGITPDSPLWGVETSLEKIRMMMTFGDENKANYGLRIAEERLSEIQELQNKNISKGIEKAELNREQSMNRVQERTKGLSDDVKLKIQERTENQIKIMNQIKNKSSEESKSGLQEKINSINKFKNSLS